MSPENASRANLVHVLDIPNASLRSQNNQAAPSAALEHGLEDISDVAVPDTPPISSTVKPSSTLQFTIQNLLKRRRKRMPRLPFSSDGRRAVIKRCYAAATVDTFEAENDERKTRALNAATAELERLFLKRYFSKMKVIGQFNLGFIIGKLDQDLFIVDQGTDTGVIP